MPVKKPNIIYLFSDQHRHDVMGCAGNPVVKTPNLDTMADEGMRFTRAYCQSPICQPSRASVITGWYTHQHGISANFAKDLDPEWPTMMKKLQDAGYTTVQVGKTHFYTPARDLAASMRDASKLEKVPELDLREYTDFVRSFGFDYVVEEFDRYMHAFPNINFITPYSEHLKAKDLLKPYQEQIRSIWRITPHHWDGVTSVLPQEDDLTCFIADQSIEWLKNYDGEKPFFLMTSFVQPHVPLMADPIWAEYYKDAEIPFGPRQAPESPNEVWGQYLEQRLFRHSNSHLLTDEYVLEGARQYYGMVSLIDQRIGDIMKVVQDRGWADNTWFLYSADHGEMLGDHNLMAKMNFYKSSVLVPAIIRPPKPMSSKVEDGIIESIDLTRTVLDIAGAEEIEDSAGMSLLPFLEGKGSGREVAFSAIESRKDGYFVMAATERHRITVERNTGTVCELFDLKEDPDELKNLVNDPNYKGICQELKKVYIDPHLAY